MVDSGVAVGTFVRGSVESEVMSFVAWRVAVSENPLYLLRDSSGKCLSASRVCIQFQHIRVDLPK